MIDYKKYNVDLHYHSPYAGGCSKNITIPLLVKEAKIKGLQILTTADFFNKAWREHVKKNILYDDKEDSFYYKEDKNKENKTYFILGCEVECRQRVHNLIYFKDLDVFEEYFKNLKDNIVGLEVYGSGRPRMKFNCEQLLNYSLDYEVLVGPAHAFTPYFGVYAHYDSLKDAYGDNYKKIKFLELGLSADTQLANTIPELKDLTFFSFSDAHSAYSYRVGREHVCCELEKPNYASIKDLLDKKKENKVVHNVGYDPQEGKYHRTACRGCGQIYSLSQAITNNYRCVLCKDVIKKGVKEKAYEIAEKQGNVDLHQITKRPPYKHLIPLAEIIQIYLKKKMISHKDVLEKYNQFVSKYTEIDIMFNVPYEDLEKIDVEITKYIKAFREDLVVFYPGGAGKQGKPVICFSELEKKQTQEKINKEIELKAIQKKLF
jgi:uncharacterized protein (TIGR00375 family)